MDQLFKNKTYVKEFTFTLGSCGTFKNYQRFFIYGVHPYIFDSWFIIINGSGFSTFLPLVLDSL